MLFEKFGAVGQVSSIRVCRDAITRRSLGYAYVNFVNPVDAERALDTMNFDPIKGRPCRIMWSQRDPSVRRSGLGNIFIKSLHADIDNKALLDTFSAFGDILSCKVVVDHEGKSRGYGFVHYLKQEHAELAIQKVNGMLLNDTQVYVGLFKSKKERMEDRERYVAQFKNVYVNNLPGAFTEEDLDKMFQQYGQITSRKMGKVGANGLRFGFVCFEDTESAHRAVSALHNSNVDGKEILVARAQKKQERLNTLRLEYENRKREIATKFKGVNLYVKNLDDGIDEEKLKEAFSAFGSITSVHVMRDHDKRVSKGFGFVTFSSADEATKAVTEMNGNMMPPNSKPLYVALAQRSDERKQHLQMQFSMRLQNRAQQNMYAQPNMMGMQGMYGMPMQPMRGGYGGFNPSRTRPQYMQPMLAQQQQQQQPYRMGQMVGAPRGAPAGRGGVPLGPGGRGGRGGMPKQGGGGRIQSFGGPAQFRPHVRNMPPNMNIIPMQGAVPQPAMAPEQSETVQFTTQLAAASAEAQKQMLGERLYHLIVPHQGEAAAKITGMLLEMDNTELLHLIEDTAALGAKVGEAVKVLQEHQNKERQQIN